MMKIVAILLVLSSVAYSQLILDENTEFGKKIVAKMMQAINVHEELHHEKLEFVTIVNTLGQNGHYTAYLALKNHEGKKFSCTAELLEHGENNFEVGRVICSNDNEKTTVAPGL